MKFKIEISYKVKPTHPDIQYIPDWSKDKVFTDKDEYTFNDDLWSRESAIAFMKNDMMIVAGGGYNTSHITDVKFEISEVVI